MPASQIAKETGRRAFGRDPAGYDRSRPDYPEWVYQTLCTRCGLRPGTATFEIGAGTGKASRQLLALGADPLVAVEPDPRLAEFLREKSPDPALKLLISSFEDVVLEEGAFDLGVSATAFHWLDEDVALAKIARLLRPGGWWAAVWNVFRNDTRPDPFSQVTREVLGEPTNPSEDKKGVPFALDTVARLEALNRTGAFDVAEALTTTWSLILDADQIMALYATYSMISMRPDREAVLSELGRIAREQFGGRVTRNVTTRLYIARRAP